MFLRIVLGCGLAVWIGCSAHEGAAGPEVAKAEASASGELAPSPAPGITTLELPGQSAQGVQADIERITRLAIEAQSAGQFVREAQHWEEVHRLLDGQHGPNAWQTINARLVKQTAERHAAFSAAQHDAWRELMGWQQRIAEFLQQGNAPAALTVALGSVERTLDLYGENSYMHGKQLIQIARLEQMAGRLNESIETYRQAFATISPHVGRLHPEVEAIHAQLGEIWLALGDPRQAIDNLRMALRMSGEMFGNTSLQAATRANDLAVALQRSGNPQEGLTYLQRAEEIRRQWLGPDHPHVAHCLLNMGTCLLDQQQFDAARDHFERALVILRQSVQGPNRLLIDCLHKLSVAHMMLDQAPQAEPYLEDMVESLRQLNVHPVELGTAEYRWGVSLAKQGKYEAAEPVLKLSLARLENALGSRHAQTGKPREALVQLYMATQRVAEAQSLQSVVQPVSFESQEPKFVRDPQR